MRLLVLVLSLLTFSALGQEPASQPATTATQRVSDDITVTATRTPSRLADTPTSVVVLSREAIAATAAATPDDMLRQVPGFTLFRRSGSRLANPTSQGVSLRGIGASGASRAVVLDDGIPLNDPFGGWIYWSRVPRAAIDRIEVLRGGASDLYGSAAMGGVVQFIRRPSSTPTIVVDTGGGTQRTALASLFAAGQSADWSGSIAGDFLTTAGSILVDPSQRGAVDTATTARHSGVDVMVGRVFDGTGHAFLRGSTFEEWRNNGTPLQTNDTTTRQLAAGADVGPFSLRAYDCEQHYDQTFSSIAADRNSERLTIDQTVPSRGDGLTAQWSHALDARNALVTGIELRQVSGASDEQQFSAGGTKFVRSFGRQAMDSVFAESVSTLTNDLSVTAGIRFDDWRNFDASRNDIPLAHRSDSAWSPRLSVLFHAGDRLALTTSAYRAFRAPTLNELYRGFRVGNVVTNANESLGPERMNAIEAGARSGGVRVTGFWMSTTNTIANVTLSTTPSLITRQRQNLGSSRSRGIEAEGDWRLARDWRLTAGWLFTDATVTSGSLSGKRIPEVPRNQGTLQTTYSTDRVTLGVQARWSSTQFDDDLNQLPLRSYFAADLLASHSLTRGVQATLAIENVFDNRIETAATPVITLAGPRAIRVGLRYTR